MLVRQVLFLFYLLQFWTVIISEYTTFVLSILHHVKRWPFKQVANSYWNILVLNLVNRYPLWLLVTARFEPSLNILDALDHSAIWTPGRAEV